MAMFHPGGFKKFGGCSVFLWGGDTYSRIFTIAELKDRGNNLDFVFNCLGLLCKVHFYPWGK